MKDQQPDDDQIDRNRTGRPAADGGALQTAPQDVVLPFGAWVRQPQSLAASLLVLALLWPALRPLLVTDPEPALGIATILLLQTNRDDTAMNFSGAAPYLLQFEAGPGNDAGSFTVTLQAEGGNRLLLGQGLHVGADGWVRVVIPTALNGNYEAELLWNDAAGTTQRRQFIFGIKTGTAP